MSTKNSDQYVIATVITHKTRRASVAIMLKYRLSELGHKSAVTISHANDTEVQVDTVSDRGKRRRKKIGRLRAHARIRKWTKENTACGAESSSSSSCSKSRSKPIGVLTTIFSCPCRWVAAGVVVDRGLLAAAQYSAALWTSWWRWFSCSVKPNGISSLVDEARGWFAD